MAHDSSKLTEIRYRDELLADGSVCRRYSDGRIEWRTRAGDDRIDWRDNSGGRGTDEALGEGVVKRTYADGHVVYGREQGFGRTAWSGIDQLTINETSFGGRVGTAITAIAAGALLGPILMPPLVMSAAEEEQLRQSAQSTANSMGGTDFDFDFDWGDGDEGSWDLEMDGDFG